jgi:protease-4
VVLRIDCPGGAVGAAQEVYGEIQKLRSEKTILASLGNLAASGGYYIASAAQEIIANPGTLTGSIGVISEYPNFQELMKKIGYRAEVLKSGRYKDVGNPLREMTKEEMQLMQGLIDNIHAQFIRDVAKGRHREIEEIRALADGRVFTGEQAKENGLIDRLGNFQDAVDRAAELAGIEGKPEVLYPEKKRPRILDLFLQGLFHALMRGLQGVPVPP